jgi:uncharacterized RDD family membrane protein YckC
MSTIQINTTQNVNIDFELAGLGERFLASMVDLLVILSYVYIYSYILSKIGIVEENMDYWSYVAVHSVASLPAWLYTFLLESFLGGQTLGKKILKIKVVKVDGYTASFADFFIRWIMRIFDIWFGMAAIGSIFIMTTKHNQRIGDLASGCAVISVKNKHGISSSILDVEEKNYTVTYPTVINLTDKDMQIIKDLFQSAVKSKDYEMLEKLRGKVENVTKTSAQGKTNFDYLSIIIRDYIFITREM